MSSRNRYVGCTLFPTPSSVDSQADKCGKSKLPQTNAIGTESTQVGKRKRPVSDKPPQRERISVTSRWGTVSLHESKLDKYHTVA